MNGKALCYETVSSFKLATSGTPVNHLVHHALLRLDEGNSGDMESLAVDLLCQHVKLNISRAVSNVGSTMLPGLP
jgi:hypothetical protein